MTKNLAPKYNHLDVEQGKYAFWYEQDCFKAQPQSNKPKYTIVIPPPNVTGKLHLGHAWDTSLQDIIIRMNVCKDLMRYGYQVWTTQESQLKQKLMLV